MVSPGLSDHNTMDSCGAFTARILYVCVHVCVITHRVHSGYDDGWSSTEINKSNNSHIAFSSSHMTLMKQT